MFDLSHSLLVGASLESFMTAVDGLRTGMLIGGGIWVENPGIK